MLTIAEFQRSIQKQTKTALNYGKCWIHNWENGCKESIKQRILLLQTVVLLEVHASCPLRTKSGAQHSPFTIRSITSRKMTPLLERFSTLQCRNFKFYFYSIYSVPSGIQITWTSWQAVNDTIKITTTEISYLTLWIISLSTKFKIILYYM